MGLTQGSVGRAALDSTDQPSALKRSPDDLIVALAGNPNVGKSTLFNALTGMNQHTGNWTGKTVCTAAGYSKEHGLVIVDLPGAYSLRAHSPEEEVARDFIRDGGADAVVVVCDALCLERNLILALQILELTPRVVLCVNLMDEAARKGRIIDLAALSEAMGINAVGTSANKGEGLDELCDSIRLAVSSEPSGKLPLYYPPEIEEEISRLAGFGYSRAECASFFSEPPDNLADAPPELAAAFERLTTAQSREHLSETMLTRPVIIAEAIADEAGASSGSKASDGYSESDRRIDRIVTNKYLSVPIMLILLAGIFWLTIVGSNYPSEALQALFTRFEGLIYELMLSIGAPVWLREALVCGILRTLLRVVAVMLPPMAIFFPLFTLLEDFGLLGRIAFNLDGAFRSCSACGKQSLTMAMGLGCNAAGVVGCRIIDSPRERTIAILTNNFMPCNGRFPPLHKGQKRGAESYHSAPFINLPS